MEEPVVTVNDLPISFVVKYLGWEPARGLWGMKNTRKPVDTLVNKAKNLPENNILPRVVVEVTKEGLSYKEISKKSSSPLSHFYGVNEISYGVQDVIYTRVFSMIVVTDKKLEEGLTFICHSFVCENKHQARQLTYALAAAFADYAQKMKDSKKIIKQKKFAIDLRTPEQQAAEASGEGQDEETDA
ncbi:uncharacterized protein LOC123308268 [Coccinella septempunctata]|uniref:uncharacterized protein LOC123308268 n=1 Tax=Coccinella septempunctata TaxID=41139 RepID=UPI001D09520B|nr:uncharacterized protein LOC123308268 [Coccinella septempunctata]